MNKHACNLLICGVILLITVGHAAVPSSIVAPFTGVTVICCFNLFYWGKWGTAIFNFLGVHATNIWLIHMFFYMPRYGGLVFVAKYPLPILLLMLAFTIASSYIVTFILKPILRLYDRVPVKK